MWSIPFDSFNALLSRRKMFSSVWFTYRQYSVSNLNGFSSLRTVRDVTRGCSGPLAKHGTHKWIQSGDKLHSLSSGFEPHFVHGK